jgi:hypothetical protein
MLVSQIDTKADRLMLTGRIDVRKQLSTSLEAFIPTILQSSAEIASRLDLFRSQTLAGFDSPSAKEKDGAEAAMNGLLDLMGSESLQIPEIPIVNSRAGLYIYLNAAVRSPRWLLPHLSTIRISDCGLLSLLLAPSSTTTRCTAICTADSR